jgi:anaerobic magnesium-protoporphyrin IX monomethyl ester cyclase
MEKFVPFMIKKNPPIEAKNKDDFTPKKITLLACPWVFQGEAEFQSQQLGLAYVGAYVIECGHQVVKYIDPMLYGGSKIKEPIYTEFQTIYRVGHTDEWIIKQINKDSDYVFINAPFTDSRFVLYSLCNGIKEAFPDISIVVGGILATTLPHQIFEECSVDIVVKGEGEIAAARILNGDELGTIAGVLYRNSDQKVIENPLRSEQLSTIDDIPWITRYNFRPMEEYVAWSPRGNSLDKTFSYITSRGCPFTCEFCSIPEKGQQWRSFAPDRVSQEIKFMIDKYKVNHIEIEDDNFTLKKAHSIPILKYFKKLRDEGSDLKISFPNGVMIDRLDKDDLMAMKDAGTESIYLPVESGDLKTLIAMNKPVATEHLQKTLQVAKWCSDVGLEAGAFFIIGYPGGFVRKQSLKNIVKENYADSILDENEEGIYIIGEDESSFKETIEFAKKLVEFGVKYITPLIATPYPGTDLYNICEKFGWLRRPDHSQMVTTISYQNPKIDFININTPWCTAEDAFARWKLISEMFEIKHNVIKK